MKTLPLFLLGLLGFASSALALKPGDEVKADALGKLEVIQGDLVKGWEPEKVYILECWATWCGPCIQAIPHINELHKKYHDKGLRVVGVNVWEEDKAVAAAFVKKQGEGMSYPVAHAVRDGDFDKEWLTAAGVRGIPNAFVVRDGKLLLQTHPMQLDDELIESLLAGGERAEKAVKGISEKVENQKKVQQVMTEIAKAAQAGDQAAMQAKVAELEAIAPDHQVVVMMKMEQAVLNKKWDEVFVILEGLKKEQAAMATFTLASHLAQSADLGAPEKVKLDVVARLKENLKDSKASMMVVLQRIVLAHLQWQLGDKEAALATAKEAEVGVPGPIEEPLKRFTKSLVDGKPATIQEINLWIQEATAKAK